MKSILFYSLGLLLAIMALPATAQVTEVFTKVLTDPDLPADHWQEQEVQAIMPAPNQGVLVLKRRSGNTWHRVCADFSGNTLWQDTIPPIVNQYNQRAGWNPAWRLGLTSEFYADKSSSFISYDSTYANPSTLPMFSPSMDSNGIGGGRFHKMPFGYIAIGGKGTTRLNSYNNEYTSRAMPFLAAYDADNSLKWTHMIDVDVIGKMGPCAQPATMGFATLSNQNLLVVTKTNYNSTFSAYTWEGYCVTAHSAATGDTLWTRMIPLQGEALRQAEATQDGGFVLFSIDSAALGAHSYNLRLTKYDSLGNEVWHKVYEEFDMANLNLQEQPLEAGGWIGLVSVNSPLAGEQVTPLVFRIDEAGTLLWHHEIHQSGYDYPESFVQNNDGSIWVACTNANYSTAMEAVTISKLSDLSLSTGTASPLVATLAPNPARDRLAVTLISTGELATLELFDLQGRTLQTTTTVAQTTLNLAGLPAGVYVLRIARGNQVAAYKVVKE